MNDSERRHALRQGVRELLDLEPAESTALSLLAAVLPDVPADKREHAWATLTDLHEDIRLIRNGTVPPGYFDDLGDYCRDMDLVTAMETAERNLDDVLDDLVYQKRPGISRAA